MPKILIVEDEELLSRIIANKLAREGYEVFEARNGKEGLNLIKKENPDLVLLDIMMPVLDGFGVMRALKEDKSIKFPSIIIISNSGQPVEIEEAKKLGAKDFLIKAEFDPQEVMDKVKKYVGEPFRQAQGEPPLPSLKREIARPSSARPRILIIEDDRFLRDLIVQKLLREKFEVMEAIDGETGYKKIIGEKPDLILLDLILPGIDGFAVMEKMKENPEIAKIPIVILSNLGQKEDVERGLKLGARDYLIKAHFTPGEIVEKVKENLK